MFSLFTPSVSLFVSISRVLLAAIMDLQKTHPGPWIILHANWLKEDMAEDVTQAFTQLQIKAELAG